MKVIVNNQMLRLFSGARVRDAVSHFAEQYGDRMPESPCTVTDEDGHPVSANGRLSENDKIIIKPQKS